MSQREASSASLAPSVVRSVSLPARTHAAKGLGHLGHISGAAIKLHSGSDLFAAWRADATAGDSTASDIDGDAGSGGTSPPSDAGVLTSRSGRSVAVPLLTPDVLAPTPSHASFEAVGGTPLDVTPAPSFAASSPPVIGRLGSGALAHVPPDPVPVFDLSASCLPRSSGERHAFLQSTPAGSRTGVNGGFGSRNSSFFYAPRASEFAGPTSSSSSSSAAASAAAPRSVLPSRLSNSHSDTLWDATTGSSSIVYNFHYMYGGAVGGAMPSKGRTSSSFDGPPRFVEPLPHHAPGALSSFSALPVGRSRSSAASFRSFVPAPSSVLHQQQHAEPRQHPQRRPLGVSAVPATTHSGLHDAAPSHIPRTRVQEPALRQVFTSPGSGSLLGASLDPRPQLRRHRQTSAVRPSMLWTPSRGAWSPQSSPDTDGMLSTEGWQARRSGSGWSVTVQTSQSGSVQ